MNKEAFLQRMDQCPLIAIVRGVSQEHLLPLAESLAEGGVPAAELTFDPTGALADEEVADRIARLCGQMNGRILLGAGTVLTPRQAELAADAGAAFVLSPDVNEAVIRRSTELGLISIPGAMTPSEITAAHRYGADYVKVFPARPLGTDYLSLISVPLAHIKLLAVGGVNADSLPRFLDSGMFGAAVGGNLVRKDLIEQGRFAELTEVARAFCACFSDKNST